MSETDLSANPKLISLTLQPYPTNDIVARCISINLNKFIVWDMVSRKAVKYISLDHTFKVASNIGYLCLDKR